MRVDLHLHHVLLHGLQHVCQIRIAILLQEPRIRALSLLARVDHGVCCLWIRCRQHSRRRLPVCTHNQAMASRPVRELHRHSRIPLFKRTHHDRKRHHSLYFTSHLHQEASPPSTTASGSQSSLRSWRAGCRNQLRSPLGCVSLWKGRRHHMYDSPAYLLK